MLIAAGIVFTVAALLWFADSWLEDTDIDLSLVVRVLIIISAMLIGFNVLFQLIEESQS